MRMLFSAFAAAALLAACSEAPETTVGDDGPPPEHQSYTDAGHSGAPKYEGLQEEAPALVQITDIAKALGYHQGHAQKCETGGVNLLEAFLSDVQASDLDENLKSNAMYASTDAAQEILMEEAEYVCTPEMYGDMTDNAQKALTDWEQLKGSM